MPQFTKEEVDEKFKSAELAFSSYYKYMFTFRGEFMGHSLVVRFGGENDIIYRYHVTNSKTLFVSVDNWMEILIKDPFGEIVYQDNNY